MLRYGTGLRLRAQIRLSVTNLGGKTPRGPYIRRRVRSPTTLIRTPVIDSAAVPPDYCPSNAAIRNGNTNRVQRLRKLEYKPERGYPRTLHRTGQLCLIAALPMLC